MDYYTISLDDTKPFWSLSIIEKTESGPTIDIWAFRTCKYYTGPTPIPFRISNDGPIADYSPTAFGAVVLTERFSDQLKQLVGGEIQLIPASLPRPGNWMVLNILKRIDCIDHDKSIIQYYPANYPEKRLAGKPRGVVKLAIRKDMEYAVQLFRPADWEVVMVVSNTVKELVMSKALTNMVFTQVT
jgi:hypothetical protein